MLVRSVGLKNVKSYEEATVELQSGLVAISGENGSGKSTILEAVGYALFGYLPNGLAGLVREGARNSEIRVEFVSKLDEREYEVVRKIRVSSSGRAAASVAVHDIELGGVLVEGADESERFLRRHLGLEAGGIGMDSIFGDVIGVPQGRLIADFVDTPLARKRKFDPIMGTEDYRNAFDALLSPQNLLRERRAGLQKEAASLEGRLARLPDVNSAIAEKGRARSRISRRFALARKELKAATTETASFEAAERQVAELKVQVAAAEATRASAAGEIARLRDRIAAAERAGKLAEETAPDAREYALVDERLAKLRKSLLALEGIEARDRDRRADLGVIREREGTLVKGLAEAREAANRIPELETQAVEQEGLELELERLAGEIGEAGVADERRKTAEKDLALLESRLAELEASARKGREALPLAERLPEFEAAAARLEAALQGLARAPHDLASQEAELRQLNSELQQDRLDLMDAKGALSSALSKAVRRGDRLEVFLRSSIAAADPAEKAPLEDMLARARRELVPVREAQRLAAALGALEEHIKDVNAQLAESRRKVADDLRMARRLPDLESQRNEARSRLNALGDPDPATLLRIAKTALQSERSIQKNLEEVSGQLAGLLGELESLQPALAEHVEVRPRIEESDAALKRLQPARDRHLQAAAQAEALDGLREGLAEVEGAHSAAVADEAKWLSLLGVEEAGFDSQKLGSARAREAELIERTGALRSELEGLDADLVELERERLSLQELESELARLRLQSARAGRVGRVLELLREALRDAGPEVTKALLVNVSAAANEIFCEIIGNYAQTLEWDENYGVWSDAGGHRRAFNQLSGGEQICAALAVRLALLRELLRIDVAFLDEPTQNLDIVRRENLAEQIQRITGFSQLLVISHDDTFERLLQSVVHVEKVNGASRVASS